MSAQHTSPALSARSEALLADFAREPGVTPDHVANLRAAITSSPVLMAELDKALEQGDLLALKPLQSANAGGQYNPQSREIRLPLHALAASDYDLGNVVFVLAHEVQHAHNRQAGDGAYETLKQQAIQQARQTGRRDYTDEVDGYIGYHRMDEASAQIAGFNAIVSNVKQNNPNPSLKDIYDMNEGRLSEFIKHESGPPETHTLKPGLTLNPDMTLSATPENLEAMGKHYFDKPPISPGGLGPNGNSDYANRYGAYAISAIAQIERHYNREDALIHLNMAQSRLSESLLEQNGVHLGSPQAAPVPYRDTGTNPPTPGLFHHTHDGAHRHRHVPMPPGASNAPIFPDTDMPTAQKTPAQPDDGPFASPFLNTFRAALIAGDEEELDRLSLEFARSPEGQRLAEYSEALWQENQLREIQAQQERQLREQKEQEEKAQQEREQQEKEQAQHIQVRRGPVMRL